MLLDEITKHSCVFIKSTTGLFASEPEHGDHKASGGRWASHGTYVW